MALNGIRTTDSVGLRIKPASEKVPADGVRVTEGSTEGALSELTLDLRRLLPLKARRIRFAVVCDPEESSESLPLDEPEVSDELEELSISCNTPGCDSSSITC
jgi:hypothetical protein